MTYVISDIHGCFEEFQNMLELINFSEKDELYIIGDVIDRGSKPIETLLFIKNQPNMHLLLGNHEYMMLNYFAEKEYDAESRHCYAARDLWFRNGGRVTLESFSKLKKEDADDLLSYLKQLSSYFILNVNNKQNLLVHAGIYPYENMEVKDCLKQQTLDDILWIRDDFLYSEIKLPFRVIFGHTPIASFETKMKNWDKVLKSLKAEPLIEKIVPHKIAFFNNKIGIDGGCVFGYYLTCIRLEDEETFFVLNKETEKQFM